VVSCSGTDKLINQEPRLDGIPSVIGDTKLQLAWKTSIVPL